MQVGGSCAAVSETDTEIESVCWAGVPDGLFKY